MIIRLSLTPSFYKGDLHPESCRVKGLKTQDFSNRWRIILIQAIFFKEVFQNTSRAVHAGEPREGLCFNV